MENIKIEDNAVILSINPKIYELEVIYSAAYVFLDRAYILLDGDPKNKVIIRLTPKDNSDLKELGNEFLNELINYADYKNRAERTKEIREMLLQRAIVTNDPSVIQNDMEMDKLIEDLDKDKEFKSQEEIDVPWEKEKQDSDKK